MPGNKIGGQRAAATMKARYGESYFSNIARATVGIKRPGAGFASSREFARLAGAKGGKISRRPRKES